MILVCGIPSETPLQMVTSNLKKMSADFVLLNQRTFPKCQLWYEVNGGKIVGELHVGERTYPLQEFTAVYPRLMDDRFLPELSDEPQDSSLRKHCRFFHDTLIRWMEIAPALVINRCAPMASNSSKPYQAQLIRAQGFLVPETLITNEPELVREFRAKHGRVIYKSISAVRSIVQGVIGFAVDQRAGANGGHGRQCLSGTLCIEGCARHSQRSDKQNRSFHGVISGTRMQLKTRLDRPRDFTTEAVRQAAGPGSEVCSDTPS